MHASHPYRDLDRARIQPRYTMVSVKTAAPIPKENIFDVMAKIRAAAVEAPIKAGTVMLTDVYGTEVIATKSIQ